jgi:hypothetical protein
MLHLDTSAHPIAQTLASQGDLDDEIQISLGFARVGQAGMFDTLQIQGFWY